MLFLAFSLALAALGCAVNAQTTVTAPDVVPGAFIVEVAASTSGSLSKRQQSADGAIDAVLNRLARTPRVAAQPRRRFRDRPDVFTGASIQVAASVTIDEIAAVQGVQNVWPVRRVPPPSPVTRSDAVNGQGARSAVTAQQLLDLGATNGALARRAVTNDTWSPHVMGQVDVAQSRGYSGAGVKIGIIDTGVDWRNPILNYPGATPCFGPGCLVSFGYDFVGDNYQSGLTPKPDNDPYTNCNVHGTHVLGIVAAQQNSFGFTGVAPGATLGMYRVFGCSGFSGEDVIVAALLRASADGCNVVSASLGGPAGWLDSGASQTVVERLNRQGVVTTVSAGNDRAEGLFWTASPAATTTGISVGSIDVASLPAYLVYINGRPPLPVLTAKPIVAPSTLVLYATSMDPTITNDACEPLNPALKLAGRVVLVQRGGCDFVDKLTNVAATGARYALIYNKPNGGEMPYFDTLGTDLTAVGSLRREDGLKLLEYFKINQRGLRLSFVAGPLTPLANNTLSAGVISDFSSFGPTNELFGQPILSAPGGSILSTFPLSQGGIGVLSGTSMATPFVAGAAALLLSARSSDNLTPEQVKILLATTAKYTSTSPGGSTLETVVLQGGGLVQVNDAINARTFVSPQALSLNDTAYLNGAQTITLTNRNTFAIRYSLSHVAAQGLGTYDEAASSVILPSTNPQAMGSAVAASVAFSSSTVTVAAGASATFTVTIVPPSLSSPDAARFPIYSGFISITESSRTRGVTPLRYTVPYVGLAAKMLDMPIFDTTPTYSSVNQPGISYPYIAGSSGPHVGPESQAFTKANGIELVARLAQGTRAVVIDLVDAETQFAPTIPSTNNAGIQDRLIRRSSTSETVISAHNFSFDSNSTFADVPSLVLERRQTPRTGLLYSATPILGRITSQIYVTRSQAVTNSPQPFSDLTFSFFGLYRPDPRSSAQSAVVNNKQYRFLLRALKLTGDPKFEADWESWLSPPFSFSG